MPAGNPSQSQRSAEYDAYLLSPQWQELRQQALERDGHRCRVCNSAKRLDVHHRTYERFGHEDLDDLTVLCRGCHERYHGPFDKPKQQQATGKKKRQKRPPSPNRGLPATVEERTAVLDMMAVGRFYTTHQVADALKETPSRAGCILGSLRRSGLVVRIQRGPHNKRWKVTEPVDATPLSERSPSQVKPRRIHQVDAA
jgi:hypothetical protein